LEDDEDIASALARGLQREGYEPLVAHDLVSAREMVAANRLHAAVIDVMLGEEDGLDMVRDLRARGIEAPIVMLSALSAVGDRKAGLEAGADDYVAKPFEFAELIARLQVQELRRVEARVAEFSCGDLSFRPDTREAIGLGVTVRLTEREALLLAELLQRPGRVIPRRTLFDGVWKDEVCSENVVDVYIGYLRRKLSPATDFGVRIETVRGRGFMIRQIAKGKDDD
jgi:DNA-binding response OmpR family regulator